MSKILVHICCSVDSHYFLQKMQKDYPNSELIGFFYDPNIHPYSEYYLRFLDVQRSCKMLNIPLIEGEYDYENWLNAVRGFEDEPEKGARCSICFDRRFEVSAKMAKELNCDYFTSTLLTSPKKSLTQLKISGDELANRFNIKFLAPDYRQKGGTQEQNIIAKQDKLYRQNYCGCLYGLTKQRQAQNRLEDELFCPIFKQIQPASIEDRIALYEKRVKLEEQNINYEIVKQRILNWRLLFGLVKSKNGVISSHILPYSKLKSGYSRGKIEKEINNIYYFARDEIKFITLNYYNKLLNSQYTTIYDIFKNPPLFEEEVKIREKLLGNYDLSTLIVVENIPTSKLEIKIDAIIYEDVREMLYIK